MKKNFLRKENLVSTRRGIIFYIAPSYGLGNNFIEISILKFLYPRKLLITFTPCQGLEILETKILYIKYKWSIKFRLLILFLKKILLISSKLRIISYIYEMFDKDSGFLIEQKKGLFRDIALVSFNSHFQIANYLDRLILPISKIKYKNKINQITNLNKKLLSVNWEETCFVHIRRGDYIDFPDKNSPAILNLSWYLQVMKIMEKKHNIKNFIVCSNDIFYVKDTLGFDKKNLIFHTNVLEELCVMSKCKHGILSASSLSWCAAKISKDNYKSNQLFIAPKYWIGHRTKKWIPLNFKFNWITYI